MFAMPTGPDGKRLAIQTLRKSRYRLFRNILKTDKGECPDLLNGGDTRNTQKGLDDRPGQATPVGHSHVYPIPTALNADFRIQPCQQFTDVLPQTTHLLTADGFALDSNFRSGTNKQFHKSEFCRVAYFMESA